MPFLTFDGGRRLNYRLDGPEGAPVLMFSNSLGADYSMWRLQVPALDKRFRVLRYDARGHGQSAPAAGEEYRMEDVAGDALALLDELGIKRAHFCGLSMGGAVGQWLAVNTDKIDRLVLANTAAAFSVTADVWIARHAAVLAGGMPAVVEGVIQRWFKPDFFEREPELAAAARAMILACSPQGYAGCCAALRDTDYRPQMAAIKVPTLVIGGTHDVATSPARNRELAEGIAGAKLVMFDTAHIGAMEQGAAFTAALADFLG